MTRPKISLDSMEVTIEDWWNILRLPLAAIAAVIWVLLVRKRKVESTHKRPENVKAEIITAEPRPATDTKKAVDSKHAPKTKTKRISNPRTIIKTKIPATPQAQKRTVRPARAMDKQRR